MMGRIITCECGYEADESEFNLSSADEGFCPKCGLEFIVEDDDASEDDDGDA